MSKIWHQNFIDYMNSIINHPNYQGLSIKKKADGSYAWIATAKSQIGKERKLWAEKKATELGIPIEAGVYAKVMFAIHPTKEKVCQICGKTMSLYYLYPNKNLIKKLQKEFKYTPDIYLDLYQICDELLAQNVSEYQIKSLLFSQFKLSTSETSLSLREIISIAEEKCRNGNMKVLGPGAMSNFPDRYDGFHTYNKCCRGLEDTGRHAENMKTYSKDRRAYEYWSDGNIHAANKFMNSSFFKGTSADHLGPISLGFVHDPLYLRPLSQGENSAKRDRLLKEDIDSIIQIELETHVSPISWFSEIIWKYIKENYQQNPYKIEDYRLILKQNMNNFMEILWYISNYKEISGKEFLVHFLLAPKFDYFQYEYTFDHLGRIQSKKLRNITDATRKEFDRFIRVAFDAVEDYHSKDNRNTKDTLIEEDYLVLDEICHLVAADKTSEKAFSLLQNLMKTIQYRLLQS